MSLLAEVVVQEWLNRQGYFTIRGIKMGVHEIDLLAIRPCSDGTMECRHIEVQASFRPANYLTAKKKGVDLAEHIEKWVTKKYRQDKKVQMMKLLAGNGWTSELVIHKVKHPDEVELIRGHGIEILHLEDIVRQLRSTDTPILAASGADMMELMHINHSLDNTGTDRLTVHAKAEK